ncbi:hypothetical protein IQ07DRAFT_334506 [Pyrenochaeta sp. DS3sAY3a]|nr:hypothetical protein IQ07DRAFT_334506 [Pyrenochaeta sp. DS3sAY3a]
MCILALNRARHRAMGVRDGRGVLEASRLWAQYCMQWQMGKGAWIGLGLHFTRNWLGSRCAMAYPRFPALSGERVDGMVDGASEGAIGAVGAGAVGHRAADAIVEIEVVEDGAGALVDTVVMEVQVEVMPDNDADYETTSTPTPPATATPQAAVPPWFRPRRNAIWHY